MLNDEGKWEYGGRSNPDNGIDVEVEYELER